MSEAVLQPQQQKSEQRDDHIHVEDDARIPWREIILSRHLIDMARGGAEREEARTDDSGEAKIEAPKRCEEADDRKAQARRRDLELEWAIRPADERGRHPSEERMHGEIVEIADADDPEDVPGQQLFDDERSFNWLPRADDRDKREQQSDD
jgi:hypothetical protein